MLARKISAEEALQMGLVNKVFIRESFMEEVRVCVLEVSLKHATGCATTSCTSRFLAVRAIGVWIRMNDDCGTVFIEY